MPPLDIDKAQRKVWLHGELLDLPDLSFDMLVCLKDAAPEPVSADTLAQQVWQRSFVSAHTIAQRVTMLRKSLGDSMADQHFIRTVRGKGYAFVTAPMTKALDPAVETPPCPSRPGKRRMQSSFALTALAIGALIVGGFWNRTAIQPATNTAPAVLVDPDTGAVRIDGKIDDGYPVFATVNGKKLLIAGLPDLERIESTPQAVAMLCSLRESPGMASSAIPVTLNRLIMGPNMARLCQPQPSG